MPRSNSNSAPLRAPLQLTDICISPKVRERLQAFGVITVDDWKARGRNVFGVVRHVADEIDQRIAEAEDIRATAAFNAGKRSSVQRVPTPGSLRADWAWRP